MNQIHLQQEQYRSDNTQYADLTQLWGKLTQTPNGYYTITISNPDEAGFIASATTNASQANDTQNGASCYILTLTVHELTVIQTPQACWG